MKKSISVISSKATALSQRVSAAFVAPSEKQGRAVMFVLGVALIALSLSPDASAQTGYTDEPIRNTINLLFLSLEGLFGALVMLVAGIGAVICALLKRYKLALSLAAFGIGLFVLRTNQSTFYNDACGGGWGL